MNAPGQAGAPDVAAQRAEHQRLFTTAADALEAAIRTGVTGGGAHTSSWEHARACSPHLGLADDPSTPRQQPVTQLQAARPARRRRPDLGSFHHVIRLTGTGSRDKDGGHMTEPVARLGAWAARSGWCVTGRHHTCSGDAAGIACDCHCHQAPAPVVVGPATGAPTPSRPTDREAEQ